MTFSNGILLFYVYNRSALIRTKRERLLIKDWSKGFVFFFVYDSKRPLNIVRI